MTRLAAVIAITLAAPAAASTVHGYPGLVWTAEGFRPVTGPDVFRDGKSPCPRVGPSWKDPRTDEVMRERKCPVPPDAGWQWAAPLGLSPAPVIWHRAASSGSTGWFHGGGGCGCGGSHTTTHKPPETPEMPPALIPIPWAGALLLAALGGMAMLTAPRGREETRWHAGKH